MRKKLIKLLKNYVNKREPERVIYCETGDYLRRWYLIPRNPVFNIFFHEFCESDTDRAYHDHPWINISWVLEGSYIENYPAEDPYEIPNPKNANKVRTEGAFAFRKAKDPHRLDLVTDKVLTLFITGPRLRKWGFIKDGAWIYWKNFDKPGE